MINENLKFTGQLNIVLRDANGNVKTETTVPNMVVTVGKNFIASRMAGTSSDVMSHMAVGTQNVEVAGVNTTLSAEHRRVALTSSNVLNNQITYVATFPQGVGTGGPLQEAGIFNHATTGSMLARTVFNVVNKADEDSLTISWVITCN